MSIAHAIAVLGWLEVRSLASTVRYIEHFANRSPALRELVLASVLTAIQSRQLAALLGYPQPEEAYVCGLFRNLGEVLIACHYPEEHSQIILILAAENIPERAACLRVLDFFWDDVGISVADRWHLPHAVSHCMKPELTAAPTPLDRCLASITGYSHNLTHALYRRGTPIDSVHLTNVLTPAGQTTMVSLANLYTVAGVAVTETREMFSSLQVPTESLRISRQAERIRMSASEFNPASKASNRPYCLRS